MREHAFDYTFIDKEFAENQSFEAINKGTI